MVFEYIVKHWNAPISSISGYSFAENGIIYIVVMNTDSSEQIVAVFPDGGYWTSPKPNPFLEELDREFDSLETYLKNKGTEIKKK